MTEYSNNSHNNNITNSKLVSLPLKNRNTNIRRNQHNPNTPNNFIVNQSQQQLQHPCKLDNGKQQQQFDCNKNRNGQNNIANENNNKFIQYELNDDDLKTNVQIVLNNINKNYNLLKEYIINEKLNKNNNNIINTNTIMSSPESDCNSNPYKMAPLGGLCSIASSQDFTHDNSDYQWFLDYG